jgi:hypothetical protein
MLMQSFKNDVASHKVKVRSLKDIGNEILKATASALVKEWRRPSLVQQVHLIMYQSLPIMSWCLL